MNPLNPNPPRRHYVSLATGLKLHVLEWGLPATTAPTVLLIHGFLDTAWTWEDIAPLLGKSFHVIAPDLRGHGDSDRVGAGGYYHPPDYVADLASLVDQIGGASLSIVGHSMGGSLASYYTGSYPDRVSRLALLEGIGPPETTPASPERMVTWIAAWRAAVSRRSRGYASVEEAAARLRQTDPRLDEALARRLASHGAALDSDGRWRFKHDPLHATSGPNGFELATAARFWRVIPCPCLHVDGDSSLMQHSPEEAERRRAFFKNHRHVVLRDAGHMMQWHQPQALSTVLLDFLLGRE